MRKFHWCYYGNLRGPGIYFLVNPSPTMAVEMMENKLIIDIKNITIDTRLVNVSAQVLTGEQIHILGANGAGKVHY